MLFRSAASAAALAQARRVKFPEYPRTALEKIMPHASADAIEVMDGLMMWNPDQRLTASQCLAHKYFVNERERYEAKERERAREKERERRERRDRERERAEGAEREARRERARETERAMGQSSSLASISDGKGRQAAGAAERWRSDVTNTEMSRSVTKNNKDNSHGHGSDGTEAPTPNLGAGGFTHGAGTDRKSVV